MECHSPMTGQPTTQPTTTADFYLLVSQVLIQNKKKTTRQGVLAISLGTFIFASVAIDRSDGLMLYVTGFHALRNSKSVPIEQTYQVISRQQSNRQLRPSQSQSTMKSSVQPPVNQTVNFSSKSSRVESFTDRTSVRVHNSHGDDGQGSLPKPTTRPLRKFQSSKRW
jgi:hypothetical protein